MKRHVLISTTHNFKISLTNLEYVCECLKVNFEKVYLVDTEYFKLPFAYGIRTAIHV